LEAHLSFCSEEPAQVNRIDCSILKVERNILWIVEFATITIYIPSDCRTLEAHLSFLSKPSLEVKLLGTFVPSLVP